MTPNSLTPEKSTEACLVCGNEFLIDSSKLEGETPCPTCQSRCWFDREKNTRIAVINAAASIEIEKLQQLADSRHALFLDFTQVHQFSPKFLAQLLALDKKLRMQNQRLRLFGLRSETLNLLKLAKMDTAFEIYSEEDEALDSVSV